MENYLATYYLNGIVISEAIFSSNCLKNAEKLAQFHKRHTPELKGRVKTEVRMKIEEPETINFSEIPSLINGLTFDGDKTDLRLHVDTFFNWSAETQEEYTKAEKKINAIEVKNEKWEVYAWYDVSGFNYWVKTMKEQNYLQISIAFTSTEILLSEIPVLQKDIETAIGEAEMICNIFDFNPENHESN